MESEDAGSNSRLFLIIAIALIGLICIGLVGLGGVFILTQQTRLQEVAALQPTLPPTPLPPTFTPTTTPTLPATDTPEPTPTGTLVIQPAAVTVSEEVVETPISGATPTNTPILRTTPTSTPRPGEILPTEAPTSTPPPPDTNPASGGVLATPSSQVVAWLGVIVLGVLLGYALRYAKQHSSRL